jgi:general stress protein CsbA
MIRRLLRTVAGAWRTVTAAALLAAAPLSMLAFASWSLGSMGWVPMVEYLFEAVTHGLMVAWLAGVPLLVLLRSGAARSRWLFVVIGVLLAIAAQWVLTYFESSLIAGADGEDTVLDEEPPPAWLGWFWPALYGAAAGWLVARAEHLRRLLALAHGKVTGSEHSSRGIDR